MTQYEEHLRDSAPDNSRWDGFDRGDTGREDFDYPDQGERVIGRMTSEAGKRVVIVEQYCDEFRNYEVRVNGNCVFGDCEERAQAVKVARWWLNGCHA
ncbi:hypothetical protein ACT80S_18615 [Ramlibacter sp. MAHUQ-53]|uniref:hypothetical protein n=1 Tax=unclassified Ramlibacter TaxID=2617605 RepID=UPI00362DF7CD